jgi:hypothetical protein
LRFERGAIGLRGTAAEVLHEEAGSGHVLLWQRPE